MKDVNIKFITKDDKEVSMGDVITAHNGVLTKKFEVSWDTLPILVKCGIIKTLKVETDNFEHTAKVPMDVDYYINKVASRLGWHYDKVVNYLNTLADLNPLTSVQLVLKEIALEIDNHYQGHVRDCKEVYIIASTTGEVVKTVLSKNTNYQCVSVFRTKEDAELAKEILKEFFEDIYGK